MLRRAYGTEGSGLRDLIAAITVDGNGILPEYMQSYVVLIIVQYSSCAIR